MKKFISMLLISVMAISILAGCSKNENNTEVDTSPVVTEVPVATEAPVVTEAPVAAISPLEALNAAWNSIPDDMKFPGAGGDADNMSMEGPGLFMIAANADMFQYLSLVPADSVADLEDEAATLQHMMNTNTFCSTAVTLKDASKASAFAESYKAAIQSNQWMCGMPDTVIVVAAGKTLVLAYGEDSIIQDFKKACLDNITGSEVLVEAPAVM